jgi:hypothetical protein
VYSLAVLMMFVWLFDCFALRCSPLDLGVHQGHVPGALARDEAQETYHLRTLPTRLELSGGGAGGSDRGGGRLDAAHCATVPWPHDGGHVLGMEGDGEEGCCFLFVCLFFVLFLDILFCSYNFLICFL